MEDEGVEPGLREERRKTWTSAWELFHAYYCRRRQGRRSPRTLECYENLFTCHVLPLYGSLTLTELAALRPAEIDQIPRKAAARVRSLRPWAEGSHTGNHVLHAMRMVWEWRHRGEELGRPRPARAAVAASLQALAADDPEPARAGTCSGHA